MKAKILAAVLILSGLFVTYEVSYACGGGPNQYPVAVLTVEPEYVKKNAGALLDGSSSYDPDDSITKYEWDFDYDGVSFNCEYWEDCDNHDDGAFDGRTIKAYDSDKVYTVALRVYDYFSKTDIDTCKVYVGRVFNISAGGMYNTIQAAIDNAADGNTIVVAEGVYTDVNNRDIDFYGKAITVRSTDPDDPDVVARTIIDCNGSVSNNHRGFYFNNGEGASSVVSGFTITNGYVSTLGGGGIYCNSASPTISNCTIIGNHTASNYNGGGMCNYNNSSPTVTNCNFINNSADYGGGIYNYESSPTMVNCAFRKNEATSGSGGGIRNSSSSLAVINNCAFTGNYAFVDGGGISNYVSSSPIVMNCTFSGNEAGQYGGGIYNEGYDDLSCPKVTNCIFWDNKAGSDGNEIYNYDNGYTDPNFSYCDIRGGLNGDECGGKKPVDGVENINSEPNFTDVNYPDGPDGIFGTWDDGLHLQTNSDCIDRADSTSEDFQMTDITGRARVDVNYVDNSGVGDCIYADIGAYESLTIWFVDKNAEGGNNGTSWDDAFGDLQGALAEASDGNEIWVADETYKPDVSEPNNRALSFELVEGVGVYGGFDGGETARYHRDWTTNVTVLSGDINQPGVSEDNSEHVVKTADRSILDGFTVTGGYADGLGGGIYNVSGSPVVNNCVISDNNAWSGGGGILNGGFSSPIISNCAITVNTACDGGGIYNEDCTLLTLANCVISGNYAAWGGGMESLDSSAAVINCTFSGNSANHGGGMYNDDSILTVTNCIFWGNEAGGDSNEVYNHSGASPSFSYCDIAGSGGSDDWDTSFGRDWGGNIDADPCFIYPDYPAGPDSVFMTVYDGLRLDNESPCLDAGNGYAAPLSDILGSSRKDAYCIVNTGVGEPDYVDIGAYEQWGGYIPYDMEIVSVVETVNGVNVITTGAEYHLSETGMEMWRRVDPNTNTVNPCKVAELDFGSNIDISSIKYDKNTATIESDKATFVFMSDSLFFITARDSFTYDHNNLIANAPWNVPDVNRYLDRMWTDGYGGSLHAHVAGSPTSVNDVNYTTISMSEGDVIAHMAFPPKLFDFEGLYGQSTRPFLYNVNEDINNFLEDPDNMDGLDANGFSVLQLWNYFYKGRWIPALLDNGVIGYEFSEPAKAQVMQFIDEAHAKDFNVISYFYVGGDKWKYPDEPNVPPPLRGKRQHFLVTLEWMKSFQDEYNLDGWYFDGSQDIGYFRVDYDFMRQARSDIGPNGVIHHPHAGDAWSENTGDSQTGLRAVFLDAYVNYVLTGEGDLAELDELNDPLFRYYTGSYGLSQAYATYVRDVRGAISLEEKWRLLGQNLNGADYANKTYYSGWFTHFKPAYEIRKAEYLNDGNVPFDPDVNWPLDYDPCDGDWFREPINPQVTNITSNSATITWTTPEEADSWVIYTKVSNGVWWYYSRYGVPYGPDGYEHKDKVDRVTDHNITLPSDCPKCLPLKPDTWYEYRIRSTNDPNDEPNIPDQIIWGYVGKFKTDPDP